LDPGDDLGQVGPAGAEAVRGMAPVGIAERDAAHHEAIVADAEIIAHEAGVAGERSLRDCRHTMRLCREQEVGYPGTAVDRTRIPERFVAGDDRDVRRPEETEVLPRLPLITGLVAARDAQRVVELEAAFASTL